MVRLSRRLLWVGMVIASAIACSVGALDLSGRECPCATGYVCDTATNTCVTALATIDAKPSEGGVLPDGAPRIPRIVVSNLKRTWSTANAIRWDWTAEGDPAAFSRYEIVTGPSAAEVESRAVTSRVFGPNDYPELGFVAGRDKVQAGQKIPLWTVTDEQKDDAKVFAQVVAIDVDGGESRSAVVEARTTNAPSRHPIFDNNELDGGTTPPSFKGTTDRCYAGRCYAVTNLVCNPPAATCAQEIGRTAFNEVLDDFPEVAFPNAFLEVVVAASKRVPNYYSYLTISFGAGCGDTNGCKWRYTGWSFRETVGTSPAYRILQVPLGQLRRVAAPAEALDIAEIRTRNNTVYGFWLGGTWPTGVDVWVDSMRIRW